MYLLDSGAIDDSSAILLMRIDNFCYVKDEKLHHFFGSDEYLSRLSNCSVRTIQRRLEFLRNRELIVWWHEIHKNKIGISRTKRFICTTWMKKEEEWITEWTQKAKKHGWLKNK